jgi:two-component system cell cycle response regulator DivK
MTQKTESTMPKILVVEDNPVEIETIKARLKQKQYEVLIARNGEDGIKIAIEQQPDLIFMDMILPGMHGLEATIKLQQNELTKNIPIVALTVMDSSEFVATCFKEGVSAFIKKPYDFTEIFDKTEKILGDSDPSHQKIMVIEQDPSVLTMITMILMRSGYHVIASGTKETNGVDILEEKPDVILWDNIGPGDGAFPFLNELTPEDETSIPIILLTDSDSEEEIKKKMAQLRAKNYLSKPFSSKELLEAVANALCD